MPPSCLMLCQLSVALRIKFKLSSLAPRTMHDLALATPPVCLSPPIAQHPQLHSSGATVQPHKQNNCFHYMFPLCLPLPGLPLSTLPGPAQAPDLLPLL